MKWYCWQKLTYIEALISKTLIESNISYEEFTSVNDVMKEHNDMKEAVRNPKSINSCNIEIWLIIIQERLISEK